MFMLFYCDGAARAPRHASRDAALRSAGLRPDRVHPEPDERAVEMAGDLIDIAAGKGSCDEGDLLLRGWTAEAIRVHGATARRLAHGQAGTAR